MSISLSSFLLHSSLLVPPFNPLVKEPDYQNQPLYVKVIFPKAAYEKPLRLVIDQRYMYLDLNGNGDITEPEEKLDAGEPKKTQVDDYFVDWYKFPIKQVLETRPSP